MLCAEVSPLHFDKQLQIAQIAVNVIKLLLRRSPASLAPWL